METRSCVSATVVVPENRHAECRSILHDIALLARKDAGCERFVVYEDKESKGRFAINEEWADDSSLQAHLKTEHVLEVFGKIEKIGGQIDNMWCAPVV